MLTSPESFFASPFKAGICTGCPVLVKDTSASIVLPEATADAWAKVNAGQTGFFRVNYSSEEWDRLRGAIASRSLSASDRLGLQNDAYALMRAGHLSATVFLSLAEAFVDETDAPVWSELASNLRGLEGPRTQLVR